jgi:hydroxyethylthiazole kinase-like sugar kinase family protein
MDIVEILTPDGHGDSVVTGLAIVVDGQAWLLSTTRLELPEKGSSRAAELAAVVETGSVLGDVVAADVTSAEVEDLAAAILALEATAEATTKAVEALEASTSTERTTEPARPS